MTLVHNGIIHTSSIELILVKPARSIPALQRLIAKFIGILELVNGGGLCLVSCESLHERVTRGENLHPVTAPPRRRGTSLPPPSHGLGCQIKCYAKVKNKKTNHVQLNKEIIEDYFQKIFHFYIILILLKWKFVIFC